VSNCNIGVTKSLGRKTILATCNTVTVNVKNICFVAKQYMDATNRSWVKKRFT